MEFRETPTFTRRLTKLLSDEEYRAFQIAVVENPELGPVIRGTGGVRKARWKTKHGGKSGGVRVVYYLTDAAEVCYLLFIFAKGEKDSLTKAQRNDLKKIVKALN